MLKKKNFTRKFAAALLASVMLFNSCSEEQVIHEQKNQTEITLSWWGNDTRNEYTLDAVALFEKAYPETKVKCSYSEWSGYEARNQVRMASGNETDVMQINVGWLSQYSPDGTGYYDIEELSDYIDLSNFPEEMLNYGRRNGVLNAIPIAMNAETLYFNKNIYDSYGLELPKTWDDLFAAAKKMKADGVYPLAGADKSIWLYCICYAEQMSGKSILNADSSLNFGAEELQLMIDFYCNMVEGQVIPKIEDFQRYNIDNGVYAGVIAWVSDALNYFKGPIEEGKTIVAGSYTVKDGLESGEGWYAKPATLYAVSKNTKHPKEAGELLDYMLNSPEWAELQGVEKGIPVSKSARAQLEKEGQLTGLQYEASVVMETNENIRPMDSTLEKSDMYNSFYDACNLVLYDKADAASAALELYYKYCPEKAPKDETATEDVAAIG